MDKGISHVLSMSILLYGLQRPIFNSQDKEPYSFVGLKAQEKTGLLLMPTAKVTKNVSAAEGGGNVLCSILISIKTKAWLYSFRKQSFTEPSFQQLEIVPLSSPALLAYLQERGINPVLAKKECKEARFTHNGKRYFAIAFPNMSGGYEIRNRYFKGCIAPKEISHIRQSGEPKGTCFVFEGFMDYLSFLTLRLESCPQYLEFDRQDYMVLNSVANVSKALYPLGSYERIHCFFDNDRAGMEALQQIRKEYDSTQHIRDASQIYSGCKDLNEYLQKRMADRKEQMQFVKKRNDALPKKPKGFRL